jgi:hypothetical protein
MGHAAEHHGGRVMWWALPPQPLAAPMLSIDARVMKLDLKTVHA